MSLKSRPSFLQLWLMFILPNLCHQQTLRSVEPPYPLSFQINHVADSAITYGPDEPGDGPEPGKFYRTLTLHNGVLLIGGKSQLFSVLPENLTTVNHVLIPPTSLFKDMDCESCDGNYIRIIQPLSDQVLLECGTNAIVPYCQQRSALNLEPIGTEHLFGDGNVAPSLQHQNSSWLLLNNRGSSSYQVFAGTNMVNSFGSLGAPAIVRVQLKTTPSHIKIDVSLKTKDNPDTVLNGPQFVGDPIAYNERIYFFFREFASEHINGGRIMYSRVSMVCKDEAGGKPFSTYGTEDFVTFVKARLECSIPGKFPYYYNEIQDIYQSTVDKRVVFAVFATGPAGVASSAVCAYRLDDIEALFLQPESMFRAQRYDTQQWTGVRGNTVNPRQATCPNTKTYSDDEYGIILALTQLLYESAKNNLDYDISGRGTVRGRPYRKRNDVDGPLLVSSGERFTQIVIDEDVNSVDVMFIGTENGTLLKAYQYNNRSKVRIVEEISLNTDGIKSPVLTMLKSAEDKAVFVGTDIGVFKVPLQHCQDYTTCRTCLDARDPYCKWIDGSCRNSSADGLQDLENGSSKMCTAKENDDIIIHRAPQNQSRSVHIANHPVNLYLLAEALRSSNLRVVGVTCNPCDSLPFTQYKSVCSEREFLMLNINGSSSSPTEIVNCSCSCNLEIDGGVAKSVHFTLTTDDTAPVVTSEPDTTDLINFDYNVAGYKYNIQEWKIKLAKSCGLKDLRIYANNEGVP